eukprot:12304408-Ditylum_brightwellii.AAC.1
MNNNEANVARSGKTNCSYDEEEDETKPKEECPPSHTATQKTKVSFFQPRRSRFHFQAETAIEVGKKECQTIGAGKIMRMEGS